MSATSVLTRSPERTGVAPGKTSRHDIQGVRALAVVGVIANHFAEWPRGGFVGVDVFFVISGFLITGLLLREHDQTGHISFVGFYRRRAKRILPAAALVLATTVIASWFIFNGNRWKTTVVDSLWSLFFAGNWRFELQSADYFLRDRAISPVQHYWSLSLEEQFYFVWPWLLLLIFVLAARSQRWKQHGRTVAAATIAIVSLASFAWALYQTRVSPDQAYFSTFTRIWELGIGAFLAVISPTLARLPAALRPFLGWFGLAGIVASFLVIRTDSGFPAPAAALPVLATALIVIAGTGVSQQRGLYPLTNRVSGYLGDISYSLYLWHFPVLILGSAYFGDGPLITAALAGGLLLLAVYSFHLVEDPIRRSGWLMAPGKDLRSRGHRSRRRNRGITSRRSYRLTCLSLLATVTIGATAFAFVRDSTPEQVYAAPPPVTPSGEATSPASAKAGGPSQVKEKPELARLQTEIVQALGSTAWPKLQPSVEETLRGEKIRDDADVCGRNSRTDAQCTWGDQGGKHTMVMVGNSLSATYSRTMRSVFGDRSGWKIVPYGMFGCPFGDPSVEAIPPNGMAGCSDRANLAVDAINKLKPDVVVLSGVMGTTAVLSQLQKITVPVDYIVLPGPPADKTLDVCYSKTTTPTDCVSTIPPQWGRDEAALATQINAKYIDSSKWFCSGDQCPGFVGTTLTKVDFRHMSPQYSDRIVPVVREELILQGVVGLKN